MSEKDKLRSMVELMNDALRTVRDYYDQNMHITLNGMMKKLQWSTSGVRRIFRGRETESKCYPRISFQNG